MASNSLGQLSTCSPFILMEANSMLIMCKLKSSVSVIALSPSASIIGMTTAPKKVNSGSSLSLFNVGLSPISAMQACFGTDVP